jgi:hypothetical protein
MSPSSDLADEVPPTESQVVSRIESALDNVLEDLDLDPNQKSVKYEKYVYIVAMEFPQRDEPPLSFSWFKWGASTLAGPGGQTPNKSLHTTCASAEEILQASVEDIEEFIKSEITKFPIKDSWEKSELDFLEEFYKLYAPEEYRPLYLANIDINRSIEFVENTVQREENLITEEVWKNACNSTIRFERQVASTEGLQQDYDAVRYFAELYRDAVLTLVDWSAEEIERGHQTAVDQLSQFYKNTLWPLVAHALSMETPDGPNPDVVRIWASRRHATLREEYEDDEIIKGIREICDAVGLLREFKSYPEVGDSVNTEQTPEEPAFVNVLEHRDSSAKLDEFITDHGLVALADLVNLTEEYAAGHVTYRGVANAMALSYDTAYSLLEILEPIVEEGREARRQSPEDIDERTRDELRSSFPDPYP